MGRIIMITSGKGGVGKTTCAALLSKGLARRGYEVLLIDGDFGLRDLDLLLGVQDDVLYHIQDVWENKCFLEDALLSLEPHLSFLGAPQHLRWEEVQRKVLGRLLKNIQSNYDFIILDSPAGIGRGWDAIFRKADEVLLVAELNWLSLRDASAVMDRMRKERFFNYSVLFNKVLSLNTGGVSLEEALQVLPVERVVGVLPWSDSLQSTSVGEEQALEVKEKTLQCLVNKVLDCIEETREAELAEIASIFTASSKQHEKNRKCSDRRKWSFWKWGGRHR